MYSTSKGIIQNIDLRISLDHNKNSFSMEHIDYQSTRKKFMDNSYFKDFALDDIVNSIGDVCYSRDGRYIFSRNFLNVKIWDVTMTKKPVSVVDVYSPIQNFGILKEMYENLCIFDKFSISASHCSNHILTGLYDSTFHVIDRCNETNTQYKLNSDNKTISENLTDQNNPQLLPDNYDFTKKALKSTWSPVENTIAVACSNCLYFYKAT